MVNYAETVVQIFSNNIQFDWENPYKIYSEYVSGGTGFFIDNMGTILTCAHVVEDSIKTMVMIPKLGKSKFEVELISISYDHDIALLRLKVQMKTEFLPLGNSDQVKQGDSVTAVGFPLGEDRLKVSGGIVSGFQGRYIQTDAPINPGNSGGPLVDARGKVIGINTAKMTSADNIGYVTPIFDFAIISEQMYSKHGVDGESKIITVPDVACSFMTTDPVVLRCRKVPENESGYMIRDIVSTSPLFKAGIRSHDIILSVDGKLIDNYGEIEVPWLDQRIHLYDLLHRYPFGSVIPMTFWNGETKKTVSVHFNQKYPYNIRRISPVLTPPDYEVIYGLVIMPLLGNHLDILKNLPFTKAKKNRLVWYAQRENRVEPALLVSNVLPGSHAMNTGMMKAGDIIAKVNGIETKTIEDLRKNLLIDNQSYITIESRSNNLIAIDTDDLIEHDIFLAEKYKFPLSVYVRTKIDKRTATINSDHQLPEYSDE